MNHEARIARLELENRRVRRQQRITAAGAAGILLVACMGMTQSPEQAPGVLEVSDLRVVDASGSVRAQLATEDGDSSLTLFDAAGNARSELLTTADESILTYFRPGGEKQVVLTTGHNDQGLYFLDPEGKDRVALVGWEQDTGLFFPDDLGLYVKPHSEKHELQLVTDR